MAPSHQATGARAATLPNPVWHSGQRWQRGSPPTPAMGPQSETWMAGSIDLSFSPESPGQLYCFVALTPCHPESEQAGVGPGSCRNLYTLKEKCQPSAPVWPALAPLGGRPSGWDGVPLSWGDSCSAPDLLGMVLPFSAAIFPHPGNQAECYFRDCCS